MKTDDRDHLEKWLAGEMTPAERSAFEQTEEFRQLQRLLAATQRFRAPDFHAEAAFSRLLKARGLAAQKPARQVWLTPLLRIAAMLVLTAGGLVYWLYNPTTERVAQQAEHIAFYLPDSTEVTLNAATTMGYQARRWESKRTVTLDGEAFFRVRKGSRFLVKTSMGEVMVMGTTFNVRQRGNRLEVTCYEGKVSVTTQGGQATLTAGMHVVKRQNQPLEKTLTSGAAPLWLMRESAFERMPLQEVIEEVQRQFGIRVTTTHVDTSKLFSGSFSHDDLRVALESISYPMHLTFRISADGKTVELSGETR